jgi:hypothetical protein
MREGNVDTKDMLDDIATPNVVVSVTQREWSSQPEGSLNDGECANNVLDDDGEPLGEWDRVMCGEFV